MKLLCSSNNLPGLQKLINEYFYSDSYIINPDLTVINTKIVLKNNIIIRKKKNRFLAYLLT